MTKPCFYNKNKTISNECLQYYNNIKEYAKRNNLKDTITALDLAVELHDGQYRDSGEPYIIHPLQITHYLILLNILNAIFDMQLNALHNKDLAEKQSLAELDIVLASALLHDTLEDCEEKLPNKGNEFITEYGLDSDILKYVKILKKDKKAPGYTLQGYYENICNYWQTIIIKLADRTSNCSTISAFSNKRMEKYVRETKQYFYTMASIGKNSFPEFSRQITIMKYLILSICETVASALNITDIICGKSYDGTFTFIKGFAVGKRSMSNTLKALPLAKEYYNNLTRKSGDEFIIHPLRVCSYLISLKLDDDILCSSALLHEIIKKCHLEYNGIEIVTKHFLDNSVLELVKTVSNRESYPIDLYYETLKQNPNAMLLKLSNRAHTCTTLIDSSPEEIKTYIEECENFIYPLCEYGIKHYPEYAYSIQIMHYHISSVCNIVKTLKF